MKKLISMILCIMMLAAVLVSCAENPTDTTDTTAPVTDGIDTGNQTTVSADTTSERLTPNLPVVNYGGYIFRVLTRGKSSTTWYSEDIYAEAQTGDPITDAVYKRNTTINEKYGVEIKEIESNTPEKLADTAISTQADEYDMICIRLKDHISGLIIKGYLLNLYDLDNMDLEQPYYDQSSIRDLSLSNKLYCVTGDLLSMDNDATRCMLFNKSIAEEIGLNDVYKKSLYDIVNDGTWTIDIMNEFAKMAARSVDGNASAILNPDTDIWGLETEPFNSLAFINASGYRLISKNTDDVPYFSCKDETCISILEKVIQLQNDQSYVMLSSRYSGYSPDIWIGLIHKTFTENRSLFYMAQLQNAKMFRSYDLQFGILPLPKYSAEQVEYYSPVTAYGSNCISFPVTVADAERNSIIIEALSCESRYTLQPAYYDVTLKGKTFSDEESGVMLDKIFENRLFDLGYMFNFGSGYSVIYNLTTGNQYSAVASQLNAVERATTLTITKTMATINSFNQ